MGHKAAEQLYDSEKLHLDQQNFRHRFLALRPVAAVLAGGWLIFCLLLQNTSRELAETVRLKQHNRESSVYNAHSSPAP